jgi:rhodanese-related sulfurtransferase
MDSSMSMTSGVITVDRLLADARTALRRLTPQEAHAEMARGLRLIDIRSDSQRASDGVIPDSVHVPRNVLEWRLDPACPHSDPDFAHREARIALICNEGYQSSLAAAVVIRFSLAEATDVIGGFRAWRAAGLPVQPPSGRSPTPERAHAGPDLA